MQYVTKSGNEIELVHSYTKSDIEFKMVLTLNKEQNEVVIAFAGAKSENIEYLQLIYENGFVMVENLNNAYIEQEFWDIYNDGFREELINKINQLKDSEPLFFICRP